MVCAPANAACGGPPGADDECEEEALVEELSSAVGDRLPPELGSRAHVLRRYLRAHGGCVDSAHRARLQRPRAVCVALLSATTPLAGAPGHAGVAGEALSGHGVADKHARCAQ